MIDDLICPSYTFNLQSFRLQPIFTNNCHPKKVLNETKKRKRKMNIPDDNVVSLFETAVADEVVDVDDDDDDDVSAWIHSGLCIIEPGGGWSHWSKARASLTCCCCCCIVGFFIWVFDGDIIWCWSSFPLDIVDGDDNLRFDVEFSVFNFDKPLLRWCRGDSVATVFGGGWLK